MNIRNNTRSEMELVPSRYDEMPTLVPIFDEGKWQTVDKTKRKVFREDELKELLCVHVHTFYVPELKKILSSLQKYNELVGGLIITTNTINISNTVGASFI